MTELKTVYEQHKENWDLLAAIGRPNVAEAAKHFYTHADMERALGYSQSNVMKWARRQNNISSRSEVMAANWLSAQRKDDVTEKAPSVAGDTQMLLVRTPLASVDKVRRVLAMMGCEFEEV